MDRIEYFEINSQRWLSVEDFDGEEWKDINGYEGVYQVSNYGRIKRLKTLVLKRGLNYLQTKDHILKASFSKRKYAYWRITLHYIKKRKQYSIHRLVAIAFIPNPNNLPEVNHKDENRLNPKANNLEWCDRKYNSSYGTLPERARRIFRRDIMCKTVHQYDVKGNYIATYASTTEAMKITHISKNSISEVCNEKRTVLTAGGFIWSYTKKKSDIARKVKRAKAACRKRVTQRTKDGIYVASFSSIKEAATATGISQAVISQCVCKRSNTGGGYKWEYSF